MSKRRSDKRPNKPGRDAIAPSNPIPKGVKAEGSPLDLSPAQFARVTRAMLAVARLVGRHSAVSPWDAVQQAWVKALSNPETNRSSTHDFDGFVTYMCTLVKYEAMTNRQFSRRQQRRNVASDTDIAEWLAGPHSHDATEARLTLERPFTALEPAEQELLHALYHDGKTIDELKAEQGRAWTTLDSRRKRLLNRLYAAIQALVATLVFVPKKARAFVAHVAQRTPHMLAPATQFGGAMTLTLVSGLILPASSSAMNTHSMPVGLTPYGAPQAALAQAAGLQPSFVPEVAREEPKALDAATNECSGADMRCTKTASSVAENLIPMTFVLGVALSQVACAGTKEQTPSAQQPEEEVDPDLDPYVVACAQERARGMPCPPKEVWQKLGSGPPR